MGLVHGTVSPGPPFEVGDFGPEVERSAKGAIYFRPRRAWHITPGELAHIQAAHPELAERLVVLKMPREPSSPPTPPAQPSPSADTAAVEPADAEDGARTEDPDSGEGGDLGGDSSEQDEEKPRKRRSRKKSKE